MSILLSLTWKTSCNRSGSPALARPVPANCSPGRPPRSPASRPGPWRSTCRGAVLRPRAGSALSSPSSREAPVRGTWTATTATSSCCRALTCSTGGASASSGGCSPKEPPTTRPRTTCTRTSSRPPARSTAWKRPSPGSGSSTTRSPWPCASPRTTSTASGAPPSVLPTSPSPTMMSKTARNDPAGLFLGHAARLSSRRARWLVRRRSSGVPFQYASSRRRLRAQAMYTWSRRVFASPR
jgi:hypothetical protein